MGTFGPWRGQAPSRQSRLWPLLDIDGPITLEQLASHPLITCEPGYTGRAHIDKAFERAGGTPDIVLSAMDADVITTPIKTIAAASAKDYIR